MSVDLAQWVAKVYLGCPQWEASQHHGNNWEAVGAQLSLVYSSVDIVFRCGLGYAFGQEVTFVLGQKDKTFLGYLI